MAPWTCSWVYHPDLMEEAGLDPRSITTWEELNAFLEEGTAWANSNPDVDFFLDQGWHPLVPLRLGQCLGTGLP